MVGLGVRRHRRSEVCRISGTRDELHPMTVVCLSCRCCCTGQRPGVGGRALGTVYDQHTEQDQQDA